MELAKVTKTQVKAAIRLKGVWSGYLVGNKVNTYHINNGWHLGHYTTITSLEQLEKVCNAMMFYMEPELGNRVAFYAC